MMEMPGTLKRKSSIDKSIQTHTCAWHDENAWHIQRKERALQTHTWCDGNAWHIEKEETK